MTEGQEKLIGREFRHFKGNLYRLKGFAKHTETLEEMVVYRAQYLAAAKPKRIFFLSTHGEKSLYECSFSEGDALVFGNESSGRPEDSLSATKSRRNRRGE